MSVLIPGKAYVLTNAASATVMDMSCDEGLTRMHDDSAIYGYQYRNQESQQWYFEERDGGVSIHNKMKNKYLAVKDTPIKDFTPIVARLVFDNPHVFNVWPIPGTNTVQIFVKNTKFCFDLSGGFVENHTEIFVCPSHGGKNQQWIVTPV